MCATFPPRNDADENPFITTSVVHHQWTTTVRVAGVFSIARRTKHVLEHRTVERVDFVAFLVTDNLKFQ